MTHHGIAEPKMLVAPAKGRSERRLVHRPTLIDISMATSWTPIAWPWDLIA